MSLDSYSVTNMLINKLNKTVTMTDDGYILNLFLQIREKNYLPFTRLSIICRTKGKLFSLQGYNKCKNLDWFRAVLGHVEALGHTRIWEVEKLNDKKNILMI